MNKEDQVKKLARTLVRSGLAADYQEALTSARSMLKIPEPVEKKKEEDVDPSRLPKLDDIAPVSLEANSSKNKALKEILEEDARRIYGREGSQKQ